MSSGDYSRIGFDPAKSFVGVLMQQGRVQLDADWNEQVEISERRFRVQAIDIMGHCAAPNEPPDGLEIRRTPEGHFTIGSFMGDGTLTHDIDRLHAETTLGNLDLLIPIRVKLDAALLHQHADEAF